MESSLEHGRPGAHPGWPSQRNGYERNPLNRITERPVTPVHTLSAAVNNALWCDAVCTSHGAGGRFLDSVWKNDRPVPRFYSNLITLVPDAEKAQREEIERLLASDLSGTWSVKDSFRQLDLEDLGFEVLFDAQWMYMAPGAPDHSPPLNTEHWESVDDEATLRRWEAAWSGEPANSSVAEQPRLFLPSLIERDDILMMAGSRDGTIVCGAIANCTDDVVGITNAFGFTGPDEGSKAECIRAIRSRFPGKALVGYDRGEALEQAVGIGFETTGALRVWIRTA